MAGEGHLLTDAATIWNDVRGDLQENDCDEELADAAVVPPEELRKVAKALQAAVTNFGELAATAQSPTDPALKPSAEEVISAFRAANAILRSLRRGAGCYLRQELREIGGLLAEAMEQMGASVASPDLQIAVGKALDRTKHLERVSVQNRASTRRQILMSLAKISDSERELMEALRERRGGEDGADPVGALSDEDLDLGEQDQEELSPHERRLLQGILAAARALEEGLKQASEACLPPADVSRAVVPIATLEVVALNAVAAASAVEGLVTHAVGTLDSEPFAASLDTLRKATAGFGEVAGGVGVAQALDELQADFDAVPSEARS